jgi:hypothetical protein
VVSLSTILSKTKIKQLESNQGIALCNQYLQYKTKNLKKDKFTEIYLNPYLEKNHQKLTSFAVDLVEEREKVGLLTHSP